MNDDNIAHLKLKEATKKKRKNRFFYKVENHHELFKIGASFQKDFNAGIKSFAIGSTGYQSSQQKTIMGLASYFDHQEDMKIAIISENISSGYFSEIIDDNEPHEIFLDDDLAFKIVTFHNHFDFLCLEELLINEKSIEDDEEKIELIDNFIDSYDLILWDVPEIHKIQNCPQIYFPMLERFESISLIVAQSLSKKEEIEHIIAFFKDYGVTLKGLLMDNKNIEDDTPKKGFFRGLFK